MAKSLRSKRQKRLRTLRREIAQPFYENKEAAKLAVQEAALNAPKVPMPPSNSSNTDTPTEATTTNATAMDVEMADGRTTASGSTSLKPVGGIGKKWKNKSRRGKGKGRGKGKIRRKKI